MPALPRALLAVLLLSTAAVAGCVGSDGAPDTGPADPAAANRTEALAPETGESTEVAHVHDRWDGAESKVLLDAQVSTGSSTDLDPSKPVAENVFCLAFCGVFAEFTPTDGAIVPPGTDRVEIRAEWSEQGAEPAMRTDVQLAYMAADSTDWTGLPVREPGEAWRINTTVEMADGGHAKQSLWRFLLAAQRSLGPNGTAGVSVPRVATEEMSFDVTVVAHRRDGPLPEEPPHPDWWANGTRRLVAVAEDEATTVGSGEWYVGAGVVTGGPSCCRPYEWIEEDEHDPVPPGTETLVARVNWTNDAPAADIAGVQPWFMYHDGAGPLLNRWQPEDTSERSWVYVLAVPEDRTDGMYVEARSRWMFFMGFQGRTDTGADEPLLGGDATAPYVFDGDYTVTIRAHKEPWTG